MKNCLLLGALLYLYCVFPAQGGEYEELRHKMVEEVVADVAAEISYSGGSTLSPSVVTAMQKVKRHLFVPPSQTANAYLNRPLPIGYGQTISQPLIVAMMTDLMQVKKDDKVLEIGTGSGYQAAILAEIVKSVYSIEIIHPLGKQAAKRLKLLGYKNVEVKLGDGYYGWPEEALFDAIIVTAAASHVPPPLLKQLKPGGKMLIPLGMHFMAQYLMLVEKQMNGSVTSKQILPVRFVPFTREK